MVKRALFWPLGLAGCLAVSGCALWPPAKTSPLCDVEIQRTSAWINAMPMAEGPSRRLIVMMLVEDDGISRMLEREDPPVDGRLAFHIAEWGPEEGLGKAVYRGTPTEAKAADIYCDGALVTSVERITVAY